MAWSAIASAVLTTGLVLPPPTADPVVLQRGEKAPKAQLETFPGSLDEAQVSAEERNVPLIVIAILEDPASDVLDFRRAVLSDGKLAEASRLAVVLLTNNGLHPLIKIKELVNGVETEREVCSAYRTSGCSAHQRVFDEIYNAFQVDGELILPFVAILTPDRKVRDTFADGSCPSLKSVVSAYQGARREAGEGLTIQGLAEVRALLARGEQKLEARAFGDAWRAFARVLEITQKTRYADTARAQRTQALGGLEAQRDAALAKLEAGQVAVGYGELRDIEMDAVGTPLEKEIPKIRKQVERDKRWRDEIAGLKLELEAGTLLEEATRLFGRGEDKKGAARVRQLFRKYAKTQAAADARQRWPELAPKQDG